jgi:glycosyltransferase involved in cell wall biosynthesis
MVIVYVLTSLGMGGAERQVLALAERMADSGHAVKLLVLRPKLQEEWPTVLPVIHLDMRRTPASVMKGFDRARRFLKGYRPEVLHGHSFHANLIARLLKLFVRVPVVLSTVHNVYEGGLHRMVLYRATDFLSMRTTAVSKAAAERFIRMGAIPRSKCVVVTNGIDTAEFSPNEDRRREMRESMSAGDGFVWFTAGRLVPAKDFPNLLRAFRQVYTANPEAQLWVAGAGEPAGVKPIAGFVLVAGSMHGVRWLGLRRDLPALLDAADGFVLASAWEGMPLVVGEAMAMQKPVVATDVGGVRELVGGAGVLVEAKNPDALAEAMLKMMSGTLEARQQLGSDARARIDAAFSIDARVEEWESLYRELLRTVRQRS